MDVYPKEQVDMAVKELEEKIKGLEERYRRRKYPEEPPTESGDYLVFTRQYPSSPKVQISIASWGGPEWYKEAVWDNNVEEWTNVPPERTKTDAVNAG